MNRAVSGAVSMPLTDICRADGVRPCNYYLWPTELWVASRDPALGHSYPFEFHIGIVALEGGLFSTEGDTFSIRAGKGYWGRPCVFPTRREAIRAEAARMIRLARAWRKWGKLHGERLARVINWARNVVARECGVSAPAPVHVRETPRPAERTGLPLFDHFNNFQTN